MCENYSNEYEVHVICIRPGDTETPAAALLKTLMVDYGVPFQTIDRGYPVMRNGTEGAHDGCATYVEVLQTAVDLATAESWGPGRQRLFPLLFSEHKIELPWVVAQLKLSAAIIEQVNEIKGRADSNPQRLIDRIYSEMLPLNAFATFIKNPYDATAINPQEGVWKLYAYARLAGLDPKFVLVQRDRAGVATHHVALTVATEPRDASHRLLMDPAYNMVGGKHQETVEISPLQALAYRNLQNAVYLNKIEDITSLIDQALVFDPSNQRGRVYKLLVSRGGDDSLRPMRDAIMIQMAAAWR